MSLLEQDTTRKGLVETAIELDGSNSENYKVNAICDNVVYAKESDSNDHLLGFYYLVLWKGYPKEKYTWESALAILYLRKLISTFYHDHSEKPTAISALIDSALPIERRIAKPRAETSSTKQKQSRPAKDSGARKRAKKAKTSSFYLVFDPVSIACKRFLQSCDLAPLRPTV